MKWYCYVGIILAALILLLLAASYYVYRRIFYNDRKGTPKAGEPLKGPLYEPFAEEMDRLINAALKIPFEQIIIKDKKFKQLGARYYHVKDGAPVSIMCHGYKSIGIKDFSGGINEALKRENNVLIIDHPGHNLSYGRRISFGVNDKFALLKWIEYISKRNNNPDIYLYGISMGAATVLMTSGLELPKNVKGVIADCPYSSVRDEISFIMKGMGLSFKVLHPFVYLGALLFAGFNMRKGEVRDYLKNCKTPILLIHGSTDDVVPVESSRKLSKDFPKLITYVEVEGAPHGMSFLKDNAKYVEGLDKLMSRATK